VPDFPSRREPRTLLRKVVGSQIPTNDGEPLSQFLPISPIASVAKRAEPVERVSLTNGGARPHHLPPFASGVARCADARLSRRKGGGRSSLWGKAAYAGGFTGAIQIKDDPLTARSIHQTPDV
jgi:hypothetical protein